MATPALIDINQAVSQYLLKYKKSTEDALIYTEHACLCFQDFSLYDGNNLVTVKVTVTANKWIVMPSDMVGFNDLMVLQTDGSFWPCTERDDMITTTTTTAGVEGRDSTIGEGAALADPKSSTYGGVGGVNDYYYKKEWKERRIYTEGFTTETVVLQYTSTGIEMSGTTYIPTLIVPMVDAYLLWKESYWIPTLFRERESREKDYKNRRMEARNFVSSMSYNQWRDLFLSMTTQSVIR